MRIQNPVTNILKAADHHSETVSQGLYGERVEVIADEGEFYQVRQAHDGYQGYLTKRALLDTTSATTHRVIARSTLLFSAANIKSPIVSRIPLGAELVVTDTVDEKFSRTDSGHFVCSTHLRGIGACLDNDLVELALHYFNGAPYVWGGRSPDGADCSGLLQICAALKGIVLPRDSGPQERSIEKKISWQDRSRNDIVFWPGHVGVLESPDQLVHANAHTLSTTREPLQQVSRRAGDIFQHSQALARVRFSVRAGRCSLKPKQLKAV